MSRANPEGPLVRWIVCDPRTGLIVRRSRNNILSPQEHHHLIYKIPKYLWVNLRAAQPVNIDYLSLRDLKHWLAARAKNVVRNL
jgi:hypothetical protein